MEIRSKDYIKLDGVSSKTIGLYVDTPPMPPMAQRRYTSWETEQLGQSQIIDHDYYEDVTITITCYVFDYGINVNKIYAWINNSKRLETSVYSQWFYKIKKINGVTPGYDKKGKYKIDISFVCEPYRYSTDNQLVTITESDTPFEVGGSANTRPIYNVYGDGDIKIIVNNDIDNALMLYDVDTVVTVDCERMVVHTHGVPMKSSGKLPFLDAGTNDIEWTGNVKMIEIIKNERWI